MSFSQLPAVKKDTKNGAPGNFFGPFYFVTALVRFSIVAYNTILRLTYMSLKKSSYLNKDRENNMQDW